MSHHIVEFQDVRYHYPDGTAALNGLSLRITHGEAVGIVGANGAGKSTLLLHINGSILPASGSIIIGDLQLTAQTRKEVRKKVGMIFQNPDDQLFMPTVYDDVAFGPLNLGLGRERAAERVEEALRIVGCQGLRDRPPHHLSSGQKSSVAIASVIAMQPEILVMDEPASSLDPRSRRQLINLLNAFDHTKIVASHDLDFILETCERCIIVRDGRVMADGAAETVLADKTLLEENNLELPLSLKNNPLPRHKGAAMNDLDKLKHLIEHWKEHNKEHARTYREWAGKAASLGKNDLAGVLGEIAAETSRIDELFIKADGLLG